LFSSSFVPWLLPSSSPNSSLFLLVDVKSTQQRPLNRQSQHVRPRVLGYLS
jgi:hypothetical protein